MGKLSLFMLEWGSPISSDEGPGLLGCDTGSTGKEWQYFGGACSFYLQGSLSVGLPWL